MELYYSGHLSLTDAQQGIWYASQASLSSTLYATGQTLRLCGDIDQSRLLKAINHAISEFEILSQRFINVDGIPSYSPNSSGTGILLCDVSQQDDPKAYVRRLMEELINEELGPDNLHHHEHRLYVLNKCEVLWFSRVHHIAFDAYTYSLLHRRASEYYQALVYGNTTALCSFASLETLRADDLSYRLSSQYTDEKQYWIKRCTQMPVPTFLGAPAQEMAKSTLDIETTIHADLGAALEVFYQRSGFGLSDILLAVFASYFSSCLGGECNLLFGLPCMGRLDTYGAQAAVTRSNILPLRLDLPHNSSFEDVCAVVAHSRRELLVHQRYRGEWISRDVGRVGDTLPLYGIELNILPPSLPLDFAGLQTTVKHIATGPVRDLNIHLELGEDLRPRTLRIIANAARYSHTELQLHLYRLLHWISRIVEAPTLPLMKIPLATVDELTSITEWNNTAHDLPAHNILDLFAMQVVGAPQQIAVLDETEALTYSELERLSRQFAHAFDHHLQGARSKVIGVALERSVALEVVLLAILRAGAVILPLSLELPKLRLQKMLKQANASLVISGATNCRQLPDEYPQLHIKTLYELAKCQGDNPLSISFEKNQDQPAYILFTSGSSGDPKGVMVGHLALANRLQWMQAEYSLRPTDRILQKTPATFDVSMWEFFWPLISGATLFMARPGGHTDPVYLLSTITQQDITTLHFVPSMLAIFLDAVERHPWPLPLLKVFVSGEALSADLVHRYQQLLVAPLHNLYGPTEAAIDVTYYALKYKSENRSIPIGRPIWNTSIHILNVSGQPTPIGIPGELFIEGICLADCYVGQPTLTAERFIITDRGRRLYQTGDLARWHPDGQVEYLGRLDQQIKIHGQRIELEEIDSVIGKHPLVRHVATHMYGGRIIAYIVPNDVDPDKNTLLTLCREYLPGYMQPQLLIFLTELPLNPNGKLDRKALPVPPALSGEIGSVPSSLIEQRLCEYFADALQLPVVAPEAHFFELGGNSLSAVSVAAKINTGLGWKITIASIFAYPSPRALAEQGLHDAPDMLAPALLLRPGPSSTKNMLPTLFCIHPAGGIAWCYSGLARYLKTPCEIVGLQAQGLTPNSCITTSIDVMIEEYASRMRLHQPEGPYWLIGWSVGGMIAHSVAACLERQGQKVELLAMMDAYPSDLWRQFAFESLNAKEEESMALAALLFIAGIALPFARSLPSLILPKGEVLERSQTIKLLRQHGNPLACLDDPTLDRLINVVINSRRLVGSLNHDLYHGDLLFFTAAAPRAEYWLELNAWRPYLHGKIHNIDIDCDHPGMARPEALHQIAEHLDAAFSRFFEQPQPLVERKKIMEYLAK